MTARILLSAGLALLGSLGFLLADAAADAEGMRATFARAAEIDGDAYVVAREILAAQGDAILPLLDEKARSKDWRQRYLAGALRLRIRTPEKATRWRWALRYGNQPFRQNDKGQLVKTLPRQAVDAAAAQGEKLVAGEVVVDREAIPIIIDCLRAPFVEGSPQNREHVIRDALLALRHLQDPKTAEPILHYAPPYYHLENEAVETLASLGKPALPALHEALADARRPWPEPRRAEIAAKVLARIGDHTSARRLVEALDRVDFEATLPVFCDAISRLKPADGPAVLFRQLHRLASGEADNASNRDLETYLAVRDSLLALGADAAPVLRMNQARDLPIRTRAIAAGVAYELAHPAELASLYEACGRESTATYSWNPRRRKLDDTELRTLGRNVLWRQFYEHLPSPSLLAKAPAPLLVEIAVVTRKQQSIGRLASLRGNESAFELLEWLLLDEQPGWGAAILPIAQVDGTRTIRVYREFIKKHHMDYVQPLVEGAILVGDPRAGKFLEELLENEYVKERMERDRQDEAAAIRQIANVLRNEPEQLATLLDLEEPSYRFAVARVLARQGDPIGVPLLFSIAVQSESGDRRRTDSDNSRQARNTIVQIGPPAIEAIDRAAAKSDAKYANLLAEALKLRINRPEFYQKYRQAMSRRWPGFMKRSGPRVADYARAGKHVATTLGQDGIPLLEAAVVWSSNSSGGGIPAFALAEFKQDRSMNIIVAHAGLFRWIRGESLAAAVLKAFGEKGIEAAKKIPPPDPNKTQFDHRRGRHRAATAALTEVGDVEGVDGILAGLKLAAEGEIDATRTRLYLRMAAKYDDDRLLHAILAVIDRHGDPIAHEAVIALTPYNDARLVPVFMRFLGHKYAGNDALIGLARVKGEATIGFLLAQLDESNDPSIQIGIVQALSKLRPGQGVVERAKLDRQSVQRQVPVIRTALMEQLTATDAARQATAAAALAGFMRVRSDEAATAALARWLEQQDNPPSSVIDYVVSTRDPIVAPTLLRMYRKDPLRRTHLASHLAELNHEAARDDVVEALRERLASDDLYRWSRTIPEVEIVARFGDKGLDALYEITTTEGLLEFRVEAYRTLAARQYEEVFQPMAALFQQLVRNGMWDPRIKPYRRHDFSLAYRHHIQSLASGLLALDPQRAYPLVARACLDVGDADARNALAAQVLALLDSPPEIEPGNVPLDSLALPRIDVPVAEVPLLAACDVWLEAIAQDQGRLAPDVRKQMLASGDDALAVGVELFYEFPVPTREEMKQAVANLTSENEAVRRQATALLAVRSYPARLLDDALAGADGDALARGEAIRRWRQRGGQVRDADSRTRGDFTEMLLEVWPIDAMRRFTVAHLDLLAAIPNEDYSWNEKPLFPLLLSVRYSPKASERALLDDFINKASPEVKKIASSVNLRGFGGFHGANRAHWGPLPAK